MVRHRTPEDPDERSAKRPAGSLRPKRPARPAPPRQERGAPTAAEPPRRTLRTARPPRAPRSQPRRTLKLATGPFRLWSAFCVVAIVLSLFAARLVQLQGIDENDYAAMAESLGAQTIVLDAPRAPIYDRNGVKLAETVDAAKLVADPTYTSAHATDIAVYLHQRIHADYLDTLALLRKPHTRYVVIARHLSPTLANSIVSDLNSKNLPGIYTEHDTLRVYPAGDVAGALIGFTGGDNGEGLTGMEASYNNVLRGVDGHATYQVVGGQILPLATSTVQQPVEGTGVKLTIDEDLQFLAQREVANAVKGSNADSGVAIVMDTKTGQILADADYPSYNPNQFVWHRDKHLLNPASITSAYEPGSVEKLLTFGALLDQHYVTPRTKIVVPGDMYVDGAQINDYFPHGTIHLTTAGVIAKSSNLGMIRAAEKMPDDQLYAYLHKFGIGTPLNLGVAGTNSGVLSAPSSWAQVTRDNIDFGQGVSVTAVQMAAAVNAIANGGEYVTPSIIDGTVGSDGTFTPAPAPARHRVISTQAAHDVARMMETVVGPDGTAPAAAIPGYQVAGKTGTAQIAKPGVGYASGEFTVSFAGFAPAADPRFVVYVVISNPREAGAGGGATAGPVFHNLMVAALQKYGVPPTPGKPEPLLPVYW
jgi:cell division protein FtsI (penicillin-binding protein 3)